MYNNLLVSHACDSKDSSARYIVPVLLLKLKNQYLIIKQFLLTYVYFEPVNSLQAVFTRQYIISILFQTSSVFFSGLEPIP